MLPANAPTRQAYGPPPLFDLTFLLDDGMTTFDQEFCRYCSFGNGDNFARARYCLYVASHMIFHADEQGKVLLESICMSFLAHLHCSALESPPTVSQRDGLVDGEM